jgi:hypothetical protein
MESLIRYLVLSGKIAAGEGIVLQKILETTEISRRTFLKIAEEYGFNEPDDLLESLKRKKLITVEKEGIRPKRSGLQSVISESDNEIRKITNDLAELQLLIEKEKRDAKEKSTKISANQEITLREFFGKFDGTTARKSDKQLFPVSSLVSTILLERLAELGLVNIREKKNRKVVSLSAEGGAVRYLLLAEKKLNQTNYSYLEKNILPPISSTIKEFVARMNQKEGEKRGGKETILLKLLLELGVVEKKNNELLQKEPTKKDPFTEEESSELQKSISGFIPVYAKNLWEVVQLLPNNSKELKKELGLGSSITGILRMLTKLELAEKTEKKKKWQVTTKGEKYQGCSAEEFNKQFKKEFSDFPIFQATKEFIKTKPEQTIGFMDLAGYFRASGVNNFNPAKALSILRLMAQTGLAIKEREQSRSYQLLETS